MEKVKVSKELGLAVESGLDYCKGDAEHLYNLQGEDCLWIVDKRVPLNNLTQWQLAEILIKGYEIEETKEEKVNSVYQSNYETACSTPRVNIQWHANGFNDAIEYMNELFDLGLKLNKN